MRLILHWYLCHVFRFVDSHIRAHRYFIRGIETDKSLVSALDGVTIASGGIDGNGIQVGKQFAEICAISAYSFVVSFALLMIMKYIPGLHLRVSDEAEERGLDLDQFFDEQIGDWSYLDMVQKQQSTTIVGEAARGSDSSSTREGVTEERKVVTESKAA